MTPPSDTALARPRVEGDREQEILEATLEVLAEVGYDRLTMDAVAPGAKASKATLYRRWTNKVSLVIDALELHKGPAPGPRHRLPARRPAAMSSAAWADSPTRASSPSSPASSPRSATTRVRRGVPPRRHRRQDRRLARRVAAGRRSRRAARRTSTSTSSSRPSPASSCTGSSCWASSPTADDRSPPSSTRSSCPAATRRTGPTPDPDPTRRNSHDRRRRGATLTARPPGTGPAAPRQAATWAGPSCSSPSPS